MKMAYRKKPPTVWCKYVYADRQTYFQLSSLVATELLLPEKTQRPSYQNTSVAMIHLAALFVGMCGNVAAHLLPS